MTSPLRLALWGDARSPNTQSWIRELRLQPEVEVVPWSLPEVHGPFRALRTGLRVASAVMRLRRDLRRTRPDVLIAYRTTSYGLLAVLSGFRPLVAAAQGETDVWPPDSPLAPLKALAARLCLKRADLVHAWGVHMTESMLQLGARPERILVMPRGINLQVFFPRDRQPEEQVLRVITTRSLHSDYGHETVLDALRLLRDAGVPCQLILAGDGPIRDKLAARVALLGLSECVSLPGRMSPSDLATRLRQSHVYVSMPETEGLSASLLEAMACGCFPIVSDLPGNREWIAHGEGGFLVHVSDHRRLFDALMTAWRDRPLRERAAALNWGLVRSKADASLNMRTFATAYRNLCGKAAH